MKKMITCLLNKINLSKMNRYKHEKLTKILTIALLVLILLSAFSISFMHSTYALTYEGGDTSSSSSVTDLKNTTWYFNAGWEDTTAYNEFISGRLYYNNSWVNLPSYTLIRIREDEIVIENSSWDNNIVFSNSQPFALDIDTYTDNTDFFVDFVNNNGIQLKVTDLTDTTWNVPAGWEAEESYGEFKITYIWGDYTLSGFNIGYVWQTDPMGGATLVGSSNKINGPMGGGFSYTPSQSFEFTITDGIHTTNPKLIAWLSKYGVLQGSEPDPDPDPVTTYDLPDTIWYFDDELTWNGMLQYYDDFMATEFLMSYNHLSITTTGDLINGIDVIMTYYDDDDDTVVVYNSILGGWQIDEIGARAIYFPLNFDTTNPLYDSLKTFMNTNATLVVEPMNLRQVYFDDGRAVGYTDGYSTGYSIGESNSLVTGFFGNFLTGIVQAVDSIHFYEYTIDDMGTQDTSDDEVFYISPWSIFVVFIGLALVIIFLKVFRGG